MNKSTHQLATEEVSVDTRFPWGGDQSMLGERSRWIPLPGSLGEDTGLLVFGPVTLPVRAGKKRRDWEWFTFRVCKRPESGAIPPDPRSASVQDGETCSILRYRAPSRRLNADCLVRIHSACATGDLFGSMKCDCGPQLRKAMDMIYSHGHGMVFYLADQEGRGIGLYAKAMAYLLQQNGLDTFEANSRLGYVDDMRTYERVATLLRVNFGLERMSLLTNNPEKVRAMRDFGIAVSQVPLVTPSNECNRRYLSSKALSGHTLPQARSTQRRAKERPVLANN